MCTAITYKTAHSYFGRTLDIEHTYPKQIVVTPRRYALTFRKMPSMSSHYSIIGMALVQDGYPLYFDAANECGLAMAGLNFPENACYYSEKEGSDNITPFEFIPWILGQCKSISEAKTLLQNINLCKIDFSRQLPLSPLHWIIADKESAITVEPTTSGIKMYENPVGVLTNNPTFDYHITRLCDFINLTAQPPQNRFGNVLLSPYSRGMGAIGLPGDLSSSARFVRAAFVKLNSVCGESEEQSVGQFFHILGSVEQQRGCVIMPDGAMELTEYTSCINLDRGVYYYTTYDNRGISAVDMHKCDLDGNKLYRFPLIEKQQILWQN